MNEKPRQDLRPQQMKPELERGDDAEIAPASAQRPEEIRVLLLARPHQLSVSGDDVGRDEVVDREPELPGGPAEAAAERKAGDAGRRVDARWRCKTELLRLLVKIRQRRAGLNTGGARGRIDMDRLHQREVDQEPALADSVSGDVMAAAPHREQKLSVPSKLDRFDDVGSTHAARHDGRTAVDHRVPDGASGLVSVLTWQGEIAAHLVPQAPENLLRDDPCCVECADRQIGHVRFRLAAVFFAGPARISPALAVNLPASANSFHAARSAASSRTESTRYRF